MVAAHPPLTDPDGALKERRRLSVFALALVNFGKIVHRMPNRERVDNQHYGFIIRFRRINKPHIERRGACIVALLVTKIGKETDVA